MIYDRSFLSSRITWLVATNMQEAIFDIRVLRTSKLVIPLMMKGNAVYKILQSPLKLPTCTTTGSKSEKMASLSKVQAGITAIFYLYMYILSNDVK